VWQSRLDRFGKHVGQIDPQRGTRFRAIERTAQRIDKRVGDT